MRSLWVGVAGAAGALSRYWIGVAAGVRPFPWPTLAINLVGSFALGFVLASPGAGRRLSPEATTAVAVGFLGAFTTFSTFSHEAFTMLRTDRVAAASAYVGASLVLGVVAAGCGYAAGRATG